MAGRAGGPEPRGGGGAALVVEGASFTVRAGDTVGLVGRNGAGKTSLLKVLGGMAQPKSGAVHRPAAFGYLPQDPRLDGVPDDVTPVTRVLGGRGLDELTARMEKARVAMEERPGDDARWPSGAAPTTPSSTPAATPPSPRRRASSPASGCADRANRPIGVLSGGERRRVELARILFAGTELLMLDEPTNHLDNDARDWLLGFLRSYRGALLVISHDIELLDESITRVLHLDRAGEADVGSIVEYKGTYTQYVPRPRRRRGPPGEGRRPPAGRDRPAPDARRPVGREAVEGRLRQRPRDAHRPHRGRPGLGSVRPAPAPPPAPGPAAVGSHRAHRRRADQVLRRRPAGLRRRHLRRRAGRAAARPRPQRRRQDVAAADPGRHVRGRSGRGRVGPQGHRRLLRPGARGHRDRAGRWSTTCGRRLRRSARSSSGACSGCSA